MRLFIVLLTLSLTSCISFNKGSLTDPVSEDYAEFERWPKPCMPCPECPTDPDVEQPENPEQPKLLTVMNQYRANAGMKPLTIDIGLNCAAQGHSIDIGSSKRCSHSGSDGSTPWDRAERCNTSAQGEIIACGQRTEEQAVQAWYQSTGHRNIMLNSRFERVGMAMHNYYWTAIFR